MAAAMLARAMRAYPIIGSDVAGDRLRMAEAAGLVEHAVPADDAASATIGALTGGLGCEASIDCSGSAAARVVALANTRTWGRCAFIGEGGQIAFAVSELLIHK
jgi:threonine dehydrogenase-like Zn-dependent dehydrogenase